MTERTLSVVHPSESERTKKARKHFRLTVGLTLASVGLLVWLAFLFHPLPPRTLVLATGPAGSAYDTFGKRYKLMLAKEGIDVILVPTAGGADNLNRLQDPHSNIQAGFVEGGLTEETDSTDLLSLGTVGYEPLWLFSHRITTDRGLFSLKGKRVSVGPDGSDTRALVAQLLKRNGLDFSAFNALALAPEDTEQALLSGRIDAAFLVSSYASPIVRQLASDPAIHLANFARADAYVAIFPSLTKRVMPEGAANLQKDLPHRDTTLLATKVSLIIRGGLHPALQYMLLETASRVHSRGGIFQKPGEFPSAESLEFPLSPNAQHYYKSGAPLLQRYMPFWIAALVEQFAILVIPILGLMYPLLRGAASLYGWGMQRKIFLLYGELHWVETEVDKLDGKPVPEELLAHLRHVEERIGRVRVSSAYIPMLYSLKDSAGYVRGRIDRMGKTRKGA